MLLTSEERDALLAALNSGETFVDPEEYWKESDKGEPIP